MKRQRRAASRGFTLLEVLVAVAILGLGLTVILSSQAGLFSSTQRGEHLTEASNLMRCKMSELELMVAQKGFSLTDEHDEGPCCDDESDGYKCSWKLERVELPPMPDASLDANPAGSASPFGSAGLSLGGLNGPGGLGTPLPGAPPTSGPGATPGAMGALGPLGALANISATQGASLGDKATPASVMQQLGGTGGGIEGLVMGFVYPSLKPMLEASIRRVTVKITWKDGQRSRELEVTQFLTRPQEGMLGTGDQIGLDATQQGLSGLMGLPSTPGGTGLGTTGTTTTPSMGVTR